MLGMDAISIISAQEAKVEDLRRKADQAIRAVETEEAVLRGMRLMAPQGSQDRKRVGLGSLLDIPASAEVVKEFQAGMDRASTRGRQRGAISREWRNTLQSLHESAPIPFSPTHIYSMAQANGLPKVGLREAENRIRAYLDLGYLERAGSGYKVSDLAVNKYGFIRQETEEAPTADAEGAS
jgi:hypothetical protein